MKCPLCRKEMPSSWIYDHLCEEEGLTLAEAEELMDDRASTD